MCLGSRLGVQGLGSFFERSRELVSKTSIGALHTLRGVVRTATPQMTNLLTKPPDPTLQTPCKTIDPGLLLTLY